jgi:hypothetical protein
MKWFSAGGYRDESQLLNDLRSAGVDSASGELSELMGTHRWTGEFEAADDRWVKLKERAETRGRRPLVIERIDYTEEEVAAADLLDLQMPPVMAKGETGPDDGNEYEFSQACPLCLSGAKLIPPFRILHQDLPRRRPVAKTHLEEYLVADGLAAALNALPGSERWLIPVEDAKTRERLSWFAIVPSTVMPPLHPSTRGLKHETTLGPPSDTCPRCRRDCHGPRLDEALQMVYSRSEIARACHPWLKPGESLPDVAGTWELMGPGTRSVPGSKRQVATPYTILSQRVGRVFLEHAAKWVRLVPVALMP